MSISLPPELEAYVESRAIRGHYTSPNEVGEEALRRMMAEEERHEAAVNKRLRNGQSSLTQSDMDEV